MKDKLSFNRIALTLAALGTTALVAGNVAAVAPVDYRDVSPALELDDDEDDDKKKKKKKKKDEGSCGPGTCG